MEAGHGEGEAPPYIVVFGARVGAQERRAGRQGEEVAYARLQKHVGVDDVAQTDRRFVELRREVEARDG